MLTTYENNFIPQTIQFKHKPIQRYFWILITKKTKTQT